MASLREDLGYLNRFAAQVRSGAQKLDGSLRRRASLYAQAARGAYERVRTQVDKATGKTEEWNVLHARESCDSCIAETERGVVPIGTLVPVGERECLSRCKCTIERR